MFPSILRGYTRRRERSLVGIGSVGFFNFMTVDMMGPAGVGATAYARSFSSWFFLCRRGKRKSSSTIYRRLSAFNALVFMVYTWIQAPRYKIHFNVAERREFHAVWLPDNIDQLLGTAWMLAWKYAHFTIRWIGSKGN
jgi:hypothetical protein